MALISPELFLLRQLKMSFMKLIRLLGELVPELCTVRVTLNGMKPFVGHSCVGPQDVYCETHGYESGRQN